MDLDGLDVQEVEDIGTLRHFADHDLGGPYPYQGLVEGNNPRQPRASLRRAPRERDRLYREPEQVEGGP